MKEKLIENNFEGNKKSNFGFLASINFSFTNFFFIREIGKMK